MKSRKFTPPGADRDEELRQTVISCISQKLQRMDMVGLKVVLDTATKIIDRQKKARQFFLEGATRVYYVSVR